MIEIQNQRGQYLALFPNTSLENELNAWLLSDDDVLLGSFSKPIRFPISGNESFLQHKHRPEAGGFTGIPVTVSVDGMPYGAGTLHFRVVNNDADGYLLFDAGDVATKLKNKYLHDAVLEDSFVLCGIHADLPAAMNRTLDPLTNPYPFVFFPVKNEDFCDPDFESPEYQYKPYVNNWSTLFGNTFAPDTLTTIGSPSVPFFYFTWVVQKICTYLGYTAEGTWLTLPAIKALVMYNEIAIDCSGLWGSFTVNAKYHVWQIKISDFFKLLRDDMGVGVFFDNTRGVVSFYTFNEISAADPVFDLSSDLLKGYAADPVNQAGVALKFPRDTGDAYQKELPALEDYVIGKGDTSMSLTIGTLPMTYERPYSIFGDLADTLGVNSVSWMVPVAKRRGVSLNSSYKKMGIYDITFPPETSPPKLLAYYGLQPTSSGLTNYPFGSSLNRNAKQETVGAMSLMPDEPDSLFHTFVRTYYEFKSFSKKITLNFFLKASVVSRLKLWQKVSVASADMPRLSYLVSQLTYRLPDIQGRVVAEATLYPILPPFADYVPRIPSGNIWVRVEFVPFDSTGLYPDTVGTFTVKFRLFTTKEAVLVAWSSLPITLFYQYRTKGYDSSTDSQVQQEYFDSIVVPANATEVSITTPMAFWKSDDPTFHVAFSDELYIVRSSFTLLPGGGYRII